MIGFRDPLPLAETFRPGDVVICTNSGRETGLVKGGVYHVARPGAAAPPTALLRLTELPGRLFHPIRFTRATEP